MSVRLVTTPWLTKNLAGGGLDTRRLLGGRTKRTEAMVPHARNPPRARIAPRQVRASNAPTRMTADAIGTARKAPDSSASRVQSPRSARPRR